MSVSQAVMGRAESLTIFYLERWGLWGGGVTDDTLEAWRTKRKVALANGYGAKEDKFQKDFEEAIKSPAGVHCWARDAVFKNSRNPFGGHELRGISYLS